MQTGCTTGISSSVREKGVVCLQRKWKELVQLLRQMYSAGGRHMYLHCAPVPSWQTGVVQKLSSCVSCAQVSNTLPIFLLWFAPVHILHCIVWQRSSLGFSLK